MIRRSFRVGLRLGLLAGIALALVKVVQGRRSASELGRPSSDWAPRPPDVPKPPPEPELVQPVILEEMVAKKAAGRTSGDDPAYAPPAGSAARAEQGDAPGVTDSVGGSVVKKASPAKRAAAKKAAAGQPSGAVPVKKAPAKKAAAKKAAAKKAAASASGGVAKKAPTAKKAAPAKRAAKKQQP